MHDDEPDTHPKSKNKSKASAVSSSANTSSWTDLQKLLPLAGASERGLSRVKLDELIQTLSE